jgi:acetyl esterase/lipase
MIDPELLPLLDLLPELNLDDPAQARAGIDAMLAGVSMEIPGGDGLDIEDRMIPGYEGGPEVKVRLYRSRQGAAPGPAVVYIHGGGFVIGSVDTQHIDAGLTALATGALVVSVDYRLAPEHPYPAGLHDCYGALLFVAENAASLGVDPARIALCGTSAGGGLGAATALFARDMSGPPICFQMLHIPELDDRLETPSMKRFVDSPLWNQPLAVKSWEYYLGPLFGGDDVPVYAAPGRATDLSDLPPAYISTAENDPLRDEGINYALGLLRAGVSVELHQFPGTFHGSALVTSAAISVRAQNEANIVLRRALGSPDPE